VGDDQQSQEADHSYAVRDDYKWPPRLVAISEHGEPDSSDKPCDVYWDRKELGLI
jgi:hypothetical protein